VAGMSMGKAILHGTFFHFLHQRAVATGFPRIHAGPDQRFDFTHGLLRADPTKTKDERRKNAGFLRIASSHSDVAPESSLQREKSLFPQTFEFSQPFLINWILNFLSLCNNEFESDTNSTSTPVAKGLLHRDLDGKPRKYTWKYRTAVGRLSYLQNTSRPDHRCAGVFLVALVLPPALHWRLCWYSTGVNTLVVLASTPSFCGSCCRCCRCCTGIVALVAPACHQHCMGVFAGVPLVPLPSPHPCCRHHHTGIFTGLPLASTPTSRWRISHHFANIVAVAVILLLPSLH
jgi:hypothetical protein